MMRILALIGWINIMMFGTFLENLWHFASSSSQVNKDTLYSKQTVFCVNVRKWWTETITNKLFIKPGIQEREIEYREGGKECFPGFLNISYRNLANVIILTFLGMFRKISGNVRKDSGDCSRRLLDAHIKGSREKGHDFLHFFAIQKKFNAYCV